MNADIELNNQPVAATDVQTEVRSTGAREQNIFKSLKC